MSDSGGPLEGLRHLSKPIEKLIDAVGDAIGAIYEPHRIRRRAAAEGDAKLLLTRAEIDADELWDRARERLTRRELRRQRNLEAAVADAAKLLPPHVSEEKVAEDWIERWVDGAQDVSDEELRSIWSALLAREVSSPGSCSARTLEAVRLMDRSDAEQFTNFVSHAFFLDDGPTVTMIDHDGEVANYYSKVGLGHASRAHLDSIGLVHSGMGINGQHLCGDGIVLRYFDDWIRIKSRVQIESMRFFQLFMWSTSPMGSQLATISGARPAEAFLDRFIAYFNGLGLIAERIAPEHKEE